MRGWKLKQYVYVVRQLRGRNKTPSDDQRPADGGMPNLNDVCAQLLPEKSATRSRQAAELTLNLLDSAVMNPVR